jgi:group I intron endonuclease
MKSIYCIENILDGKKYFGSSMNIEKRLNSHRGGLRKGHHINVYLQRAYSKYGEGNFSFYVVEDTGNPTKSELFIREQWYIDNNDGGYNIAPANGGDTLSNHPDRERIILERTQSHRDWVASLSEEERNVKWSKKGSDNPNWRGGSSSKICPVCDFNKIAPTAKTCNSCRDKTGENNPFFGKKHTEKTKESWRKQAIENSWIRGIDPSKLTYTKKYEITYPDGSTKTVYGLKIIAEEFNVSITNVHATINRMTSGKIPSKSVFKGHLIKEMAV